MVADMMPRSQVYVSVGSRRYNEWQTFALEASTDREEISPEAYEGPVVDQQSYSTPRKNLKKAKTYRQKKRRKNTLLTSYNLIET